jgi:hypothetical protein
MSKLKKSLVVLPLAAALVLNGGCATMFHGSTQQVAIRSNMPDADIYVNEAYVGRGNGVTTFKKSSNYMITVRKDGCQAAMMPASKSFDAVTLLGFLIDFGLVSILVVDGAATGAWSQFDQTSFVIDPNCARATPAIAPVPAASAVALPVRGG